MPGTPPGPPDPMTALAEGAAQAHEMYDAYVGAGFTPTQALHLVTALLVAYAHIAATRDTR